MKKIITTLALIAGIFTSSVFAANNFDVNPQVLNAFKNDFKNANDVVWIANNNLYKAAFDYNGQFVSAYYTSDGALSAISRNIKFNQLPLTLQFSIKQNYSDYWISDIFELNKNNSSSYFITLENATSKLILTSNDLNNWETYSKQEKA